MIIIDLSQIVMAAIHSTMSRNTGMQVDDAMVRHVALRTIRFNVNKFKHTYGSNVIIACDSKPYWRTQIFGYYKGNRAKAKDASAIDFEQYFKSLNVFIQELKTYFPYRVVEVPTAEADDIIGVLCHRFGVDFGKAEAIVIVSGDHDFKQLQKFNNVDQWAPVQKKFVKHDSPGEYLKEHIVKGDSGDGIPNIFSDQDTLVTPGKRQKTTTAKKLKEINDTLHDIDNWEPELKRRYLLNEQLVDLSKVPEDIKSAINKEYDEQEAGHKRPPLQYFIKFKLREHLKHINEF